MPFLDTPNTTMYYDIFEPNFTTLPFASHVHTVLLIHGFGGTPGSDFGAQLPVLLGHFRVIAPHLHGYGRSTHRSRYALSFYRDDAADLVLLLDSLNIDKVLVLGFTPHPISSLAKTSLTIGYQNLQPSAKAAAVSSRGKFIPGLTARRYYEGIKPEKKQ